MNEVGTTEKCQTTTEDDDKVSKLLTFKLVGWWGQSKRRGTNGNNLKVQVRWGLMISMQAFEDGSDIVI